MYACVRKRTVGQVHEKSSGCDELKIQIAQTSLLITTASSSEGTCPSTSWPFRVGSASETTGGPVKVLRPLMKYHNMLMRPNLQATLARL